MKTAASALDFARRLGHDFARPELLVQALTHGSLASANRPHNQRLEFLGDRVLGLVIAEALLERHPEATEGELAPRLNALVRGETCADVARELGLGQALRLGRGEMLTGGRRRDAALGDAMEAVLAAVFLDAGWAAARAVVLRHWGGRLAQAVATPMPAKTALLERAQAQGLPPPTYAVLDRSGPDHAPRFRIRASLADGRMAEAEGAGTKRSVEQEAARRLLDALDRDEMAGLPPEGAPGRAGAGGGSPPASQRALHHPPHGGRR